MVPGLLTNTFLAPALAVLQNNVPADRRSSSSAMLLFVLNLVGLGGGPLYVGILSDHLTGSFGHGALRLAMMGLTPFFLLAVAAHYAASLSIGRDSRQIAQTTSSVSV
jgi:hypothetical protein